jgi:alpha,alpha-trehalase
VKYVFHHWPDLARRLRQGQGILWLFDYDGTLAPLAGHPRRAVTPPRIRLLLRTLARRFPGRVGILSGRPLKDVRQKMGLRTLLYGGAHGFEIQGPGFRREHRVPRRRKELWETLRKAWSHLREDIPGLWMEHKRWALCIHYRQTRTADGSRVEALLRRIRAEANARGFPALPGLKTLEIFADSGWDKRRAARWLMKRCRSDKVFYVGDDTTDETVFAGFGRKHITIRVEPKRGSRAAYYLKNQREVEKLLTKITRL